MSYASVSQDKHSLAYVPKLSATLPPPYFLEKISNSIYCNSTLLSNTMSSANYVATMTALILVPNVSILSMQEVEWENL